MFPQFFEFKEDHLLNKILDSLAPDNWAICISDSTKNDLCNKFPKIDPSRVFVTPLAASELFYPCNDFEQISLIRKKYNIPDAPYILSLSTLEPRKNIDHTIRCFAHLSQQEHIKDLSLVLVGTKGWDYNKIFEEISNNNSLQDRIIVTGYVADEDLAALYSGAMAFVYPSFYEGFGLPPLEAMQCGIPVITSNTSSLPEVVGDAGIMVSPTDTDALCQSMLEIYNNPSLRKTMSLRSIERSKQFSWEKCTQETINAYKTALSS
jgi:glycosyltransferase involved in cell wall biosynthesis